MKYLRIILTPFHQLVGFFILLLLLPFSRIERDQDIFLIILKENSWPLNKSKPLGGWYLKKSGRPWGGTTLFSNVVLVGRKSEDLIYHERQHVRHFFVISLANLPGFIMVAAAYPWYVGLFFWYFSTVLTYFLGYFDAKIEKKSAYRGNFFEEHAYAMEKGKK